jgi:hypothetical protein
MDIRDVLVVDDEGLEEVGDDCLLKGLATLFPSSVGETVSAVGVYDDTAFANFESNGPAPLLRLFHACLDPLFAVRVYAIGGSVLRLVRLEGRMEDIRSVLDLEVERVV